MRHESKMLARSEEVVMRVYSRAFGLVICLFASCKLGCLTGLHGTLFCGGLVTAAAAGLASRGDVSAMAIMFAFGGNLWPHTVAVAAEHGVEEQAHLLLSVATAVTVSLYLGILTAVYTAPPSEAFANTVRNNAVCALFASLGVTFGFALGLVPPVAELVICTYGGVLVTTALAWSGAAILEKEARKDPGGVSIWLEAYLIAINFLSLLNDFMEIIAPLMKTMDDKKKKRGKSNSKK